MRIACVCLAAVALWNSTVHAGDLADHPRPDWARPWTNLNGEWRFEFDPDDVGARDRWFEGHLFSRTIVVPFPWQSRLSQVHDTAYQGAAWYERDVRIPPDAGPRVFLVFGAVDWLATVWVNGSQLAEHEGGYTPFEVELTDVAPPGETVRVTLRAFDVTDPETPNGKQTGWYTRTGGIWQTVYLESRGRSYLKRARIIPDIEQGQADVLLEVEAAAPGWYRIHISAAPGRLGEDGVARKVHHTDHVVHLEAGAHPVEVPVIVTEPRLWTPDSPTLYDTQIDLRYEGTDAAPASVDEDRVHTYFGMRDVARGPYGNSAYEYILLNGKPVYLRGALHQSFNPDGIYTHPDDAYLRRDYEKAKELGLNFIRIHIKIDEPRALYWADRLGIMLMCDMPNYQRHTPRAQRLWEQTMREAIARDCNHPSIISWCCFNETWGIGDGGYHPDTQEWVRDMYLLAKQLDPTRLVEDNSPCRYDHVETDINSWHFYIDDFERAKRHIAEVVEMTYPGSTFNYADGWRQGTAPLINSEYGGVSAGSGDRDISWVFLFLTNLLRKHDRICGYVYTELEDIEWEHNGFLNYDRSDKEYHYPAGITVADLQREEFPVLDCGPYLRAAPGERVSIPVHLSHWSERDGLVLRMSAHGETIDGEPWYTWLDPQERAVSAEPFTVAPQGVFAFDLPDANGLLHAVVEVLDRGERCAANYCVVDVRGGTTPLPATHHRVNIPVADFAEAAFERDPPRGPAVSPNGSKVWGTGRGHVKYRVRLPEAFDPSLLDRCTLMAEIGAKADAERLDWPDVRKEADYPQTDRAKHPTELVISLNGTPCHRGIIADDYADARGVLSHVSGFHHGSHGEVLRLAVEGEALAALKQSLEGDRVVVLRFEVPEDAEHVGGLSLYGADMGMFPADPALLFEFRSPISPGPDDRPELLDTWPSSRLQLIPTGPDGHPWRFTTDSPGEEWFEPAFDDSAWRSGKGGFGTDGTPGARIGTRWSTPDIWLRTTVAFPAEMKPQPVWLELHHDEGVEVYVNGHLLLEREGFRADYDRFALDAAGCALFRPGEENTIAVHCHQTGGGQFVDLGVAVQR